jgi:hypothetical protein
MGADRDKGSGTAARARKPYAAPLFRRASALALSGMAAAMITRRRAGWPVRRVSMRSRITRQSPAYAPCDSFADVSAPAPAIASADIARKIRLIKASTPIGEKQFWLLQEFEVPGTLRPLEHTRRLNSTRRNCCMSYYADGRRFGEYVFMGGIHSRTNGP